MRLDEVAGYYVMEPVERVVGLAKVVMDQTCFAPVGLSMFYIGLSTLEGKDREGIYKEWREKFPNTWAVSTRESGVMLVTSCPVRTYLIIS